MSCFHVHVKVVSRSAGSTACGAAAYIAGAEIFDQYYGIVEDFTEKEGVVFSKILAPEYVPERLRDRTVLWNEVETNERRRDAQLAYSMDIALQNEFTPEENKQLLLDFVKENMVARGMICDVAIHIPKAEKGKPANPHAHILAPIRPYLPEGRWGAKQRQEYVLDANGQHKKNVKGRDMIRSVPNTDWGKSETLRYWREEWANMVNKKFEEKGLSDRIDHRSYKAQGIEKIPQVHEGVSAGPMAKKGETTGKKLWNEWVRETNAALLAIPSVISDLIHQVFDEWKKEKEKNAERGVIYSALFEQSIKEMEEIERKHPYRNGKKILDVYERMMDERRRMEQKQLYTMEDITSQLAHAEKVEKDLAVVIAPYEELKILKDKEEALVKYQKFLPVFQELCSIKFTKPKEAFKEEHRKELRQFYWAKGRLEKDLPISSFEAAGKEVKERIEVLSEYLEEEYRNCGIRSVREEIVALRHIKTAVEEFAPGLTAKKKDDVPELSQPERVSFRAKLTEKKQEAARRHQTESQRNRSTEEQQRMTAVRKRNKDEIS